MFKLLIGITCTTIFITGCSKMSGESAKDSSSQASAEASVVVYNSLIKNTQSDLCIDIANGSSAPGNPIDQQPCYGQSTEYFYLLANSDGSYLIQSQNTNLYLDYSSGSTVVQQVQSANSLNQKWLIVKNSDGSFSLYTVNQQLCLNNSSLSSGSDMIVSSCATATNPKFIMSGFSGPTSTLVSTPAPIASPSPAASPSPIASPSPAISPSPAASPQPVASPSPAASPSAAVASATQSAFSFILGAAFQAEHQVSSSDLVTWSNQYVGYIDPGDWIEYQNVNFGSGANAVSATVAVAQSNAGQFIQFRLDSPTAPIIATLTVASTGSWSTYVPQTVQLSSVVSGVHNLYLTFAGYGGVCNYAGLVFTAGGSSPTVTPSSSPSVAPSVAPSAAPSTAPSSSASVVANAYFVSPSGNDSAAGSINSPFLTLAKAQSAMQSQSTIKTVYLRAGTYSLSSTISLSANDNGEAWVGYPGETAVINANGADAFDLNSTSNIIFENLTIQNVFRGIYLNSYALNTKIRWNNFSNCTLNCINSNYYSGSSTIDSNTFNGGGSGVGDPYGRPQGTYDAAIYLNFDASNNTITHNLIQNFQAAGISIAGGSSSEINNNNLIDRNIIKNVNTTLYDSGAIYMIDRGHVSTGNIISNNYVSGNGSTSQETKAIYLDDEMSNVSITGNICQNCGQYGIQYHGGDHNLVTNNIFDLSSGAKLGLYQDDVDPGLGLPNYGMAGNTFENNIVYFATSAPSSLWDYDNNYGTSNVSITPLNDMMNLYFSATGAGIPNSSNVVDAQPKYGNPNFLNPSQGLYQLGSGSAATQINFQILPTNLGPLAIPSQLPQ